MGHFAVGAVFGFVFGILFIAFMCIGEDDN